ncbi:hypothetical protein [Aquimarina sp. 2201CG14-23]|uniref:hypothetical protein n=1 Tax=Aquimarina mycalae TaxID=3040073 RepID=UPI002477CC18|nr:hypothetical protein [Aquimarina sp. 2201CG14-23]MDH7443994.1 hypothetical protein [Aquimarina sp. 2201CG14-23]
MKAAPACLMLITLLSSSLLFSQENISKENTVKQITKIVVPAKNKDSNQQISKTTHYNKIANVSLPENSNVSKVQQVTTKRKAIMEVSTSTVPRTTLDFF